MKPITSLENSELIAKIYESNKLTDNFKKFILDSEGNMLNDMIDYIHGTADYEIGFYNKNYINVTNPYNFIDGIEKLSQDMGVSDQTLSLIHSAQKLRHNNLFEHTVKKVADSLLNELNDFCSRVEKVCYKIYTKVIDDDVLYYIDWFVENENLDGIYIDNNGQIMSLQKYN